MLARNFPAIDIDIDDAQLTKRVVKLATDMVGNAPVRARGPRALLPYRTDEPIKKTVVSFVRGDEQCRIEILGDGQQYVVDGTRGTEPYRWAPVPLWELTPDDVTRLHPMKLDGFLEAVIKLMEEEGWSGGYTGRGTLAPDRPIPDQESLRAPSIDALREALDAIPNNESWNSRDDWLKMMAAIRGAGSMDLGAARALAADWSASWTEGGGDVVALREEAERVFDSFTGGVALGWDWIKAEAREGDFDDVDDFFEPVDFVGDETPPPPAAPPFVPNPFEIEGVVLWSDIWRVMQILPQLRGRLRYVSGVWYVWDEVWQHDELGTARHLVELQLTALALRVRAYADTLADNKARKAVVTIARGLQSRLAIDNVLSLLGSQAQIALRRGDLDQHKYLLGTPQGVVDLRDGTLRDSCPDDLISRSTAVAPRAGPMPGFQSFLDQLTGGDADLQRFLQRYLGYALTGDMSEKVFLYGFGSNSDTGKSTLIHICHGVMGDYAATVDVMTFVSQARDATGYVLSQLPGVRLVTATEPARGHSWDEKTVKAVTGGDEIQVRPIYGKPFSYHPEFKLLIAGNHEPALRAVDDAMRRRILIYPMNHKVPEDQIIKNLAEQVVEEEGGAILHWIVEGAVQWAAEGLGPVPEAVLDATEGYAEGEDLIREWLESETTTDPDAFTEGVALFQSWRQWCHAREYPVLTHRRLTQELKARGLTYGRTSTKRGFRGIALRPTITFTHVEES